MIIAEGPETVAAVYLEPVQNAGGCLVPRRRLLPAGARDLRPPRRAARVRRGDLRLRPPRRLVRRQSRLGYQPDMLTFAKGVTSGYAPLGGVLVSDRIAEPFLAEGTRRSSTASPSPATR